MKLIRPPGQASHQAYVDVPLTPATLDRWVPRNSIAAALRRELPHVRGTVLDVGCGHQPYRDVLTAAPSRATRYIGVDIPSPRYRSLDVAWDGRALPFTASSIDHVVLTEVLEHCPDPAAVLAEAARVLRPGGRLFLTVPFLWPLHDSPHDEYRFTPYSLERLLRDAGFATVRLEALGGWDASLAQLLGLWARRRPMSRRRRAAVTRLLLPLVRALAKRDRPPREFRDGVMLTGLAGWAVKG